MANTKLCTTHCPSGWTKICGGISSGPHPDNFDCKTHCENNDPCRDGGGTIIDGSGGGRPTRPNLTQMGAFSKATGGFKRARRGGTGQAVTWRKQSGASEGGLFGLSTTQLLIAGAVGVGAYLILKKRKK